MKISISQGKFFFQEGVTYLVGDFHFTPEKSILVTVEPAPKEFEDLTKITTKDLPSNDSEEKPKGESTNNLPPPKVDTASYSFVGDSGVKKSKANQAEKDLQNTLLMGLIYKLFR